MKYRRAAAGQVLCRSLGEANAGTCPALRRVNRYLPLISGVVIRVKRYKSKEVAIAVPDGADLLAQPQGIHLRVTGALQVTDVLPLVTRVTVQRVPFQLTQSP